MSQPKYECREVIDCLVYEVGQFRAAYTFIKEGFDSLVINRSENLNKGELNNICSAMFLVHFRAIYDFFFKNFSSQYKDDILLSSIYEFDPTAFLALKEVDKFKQSWGGRRDIVNKHIGHITNSRREHNLGVNKIEDFLSYYEDMFTITLSTVNLLIDELSKNGLISQEEWSLFHIRF